MRCRRTWSALLGVGVMLAVPPFACGPDSGPPALEPGCFARNPREAQVQELLDYLAGGAIGIGELATLQAEAGFCEHGPDESGIDYPAQFDEWMPIRVEQTEACFDVAPDEPCESCPEFDAEAAILEQYAEEQDQWMCPNDPAARKIHAWQLGCVSRLNFDGQWRCCYNAAVVSECDTEPNQQ